MAERLSLTDNAVRAHLTTLERDGLIRQSGVRRGSRKPHFTYSLTPEAESSFPKAYNLLRNQLTAVLEGYLTGEELEKVLREVGRGLAGGASSAGDTHSRPLSPLTRRYAGSRRASSPESS